MGKTRAFDGTTLYLPKKITETTMTFQTIRPTDNTPVTMFLTLVAVVNYSDCVQLFNIIFRRVGGLCYYIPVILCVPVWTAAGVASSRVEASGTSLL